MKEASYHEPVLVREVVAVLQPTQGKYYLDATLGGGGHSEALLNTGARVLGWDRDPESIQFAAKRLERFGDRFLAEKKNFSQINELPANGLDGVLLDLGVSSHQFDTPERGFSFRFDAPLDMRMDPSQGQPLFQLLQTVMEEDMAFWLREYGEEPKARAIAREIVKARSMSRPVKTTQDLVAVIERVYPGGGPRSHHPATRSFQAFRIAVNDEMGALKKALELAEKILKPQGRLAVITFHSLEDRLVKQVMKEKSRAFEETPRWPNSVPNPKQVFQLVTKKPIVASAEEIANNPRARSAKLRVVEKLTFEKESGVSYE
ncbi:MAG: 16S rRNA (cytosine(1402)-N(4))-methyltransferase RsmH [Verrucomicrobiae bacterium]|nr:16S rRNA (cytosine(1402)-N(4))-methyltransferase RsmH [Verrucomicrobiae bacterium]